MKIKLSSSQAFSLAEVFAVEIHARVIEMHLWTCDHVFHTPEAPWAVKEPRASFDEVCAAIRALKPGTWERKDFVSTVGWHFKRIRAEKGTLPKWQDALARVREVNKDVVPTPFVYTPKEVAA